MTLKKGSNRPGLPAVLAALLGTWRRGQAVPTPLKEHAVQLRSAEVGPKAIAKLIGVSPEAIRLWVKAARVDGSVAKPATPPVPDSTSSQGAGDEPSVNAPTQVPRDNAHGLSDAEICAILTLKKQHTSMGPAQIRTQLKRFKGWRLSVRAIARVLRKNGYELVHIGSRPKDEVVHRWEAPHRNAVWQMDFAELRVGPERTHLLVILDDFSRYVVGWSVLDEPTSEAVCGVIKEGIRRHGKPESVYTDRGGAFLAWRHPSDFERFLESEEIDHHVGASYRPQGRGKVESLIGTIQRELWNVVHFESVDQARERLQAFFLHYNERRAHMGIDGLTPADRYFGRWEEVKASMEAVSRRRQTEGGAVLKGALTEEVGEPGGPAEVLRLVVIGGHLEVRFMGHRVDLGLVSA